MTFGFPHPQDSATLELVGGASSKWWDTATQRVSSRRIVPTLCRNGAPDSFDRLGFQYFNDPCPITENKKIIATSSDMVDESMSWKPRKRIVVPPSMLYREGLETVNFSQQVLYPRRRVMYTDSMPHRPLRKHASAFDMRSKYLVRNLENWEHENGLR